MKQQQRPPIEPPASLPSLAAIDKVGTELGKVYEAQRRDSALQAATKNGPGNAYQGVDFSNQTSSLEEALDQLKGEKHNLVAGYKESDQTTTASGLEEQKANQERAATASRKAADAAHKAIEATVKAWDQDLEIFLKWQEYEAGTSKLSGDDFRDREKSNFLSSDDNKQLDQSGAGSADRIAAMRASIDANKENSDIVAQQSLDMQLATGQISERRRQGLPRFPAQRQGAHGVREAGLHGSGEVRHRNMTPEEWTAVRLSLLVATTATLASLPFGVAIAWLLARGRFWGKSLLDTLVHLPLILPPVVTGYLLLISFGKRGPIGAFLDEQFGIVFSFRWTGAALACAVMGFPLLVRAIRLSIEAVDTRLESAAGTLAPIRSWCSPPSPCRSACPA